MMDPGFRGVSAEKGPAVSKRPLEEIACNPIRVSSWALTAARRAVARDCATATGGRSPKRGTGGNIYVDFDAALAAVDRR